MTIRAIVVYLSHITAPELGSGGSQIVVSGGYFTVFQKKEQYLYLLPVR